MPQTLASEYWVAAFAGTTERMKPLAPISSTARVALGILFFVLFVAAWAGATLGGFVSKTSAEFSALKARLTEQIRAEAVIAAEAP